MPAGLSAGGYLAFIHETTMGTYLPPTTAGTVFIPILDEGLTYQEDRYFSEAIRNQTVDNASAQGYYSAAGDIVMEADPQWLPYFLYCTRHTIVKTGTGPYTYVFTPNSSGAASTGTGANPRTASITIVRNGIGFGYAGCVVGGMSFTVETGVLRVTFNVLGLSEATPGGNGTPTWTTPTILGADAHAVSVGTAGAPPTFSAVSNDFNGFTFNVNHNAAAQNRIRQARSAAYISYGKTEATVETELDFIDKTEYDNFKAATTRAVKLESVAGGGTYTAATTNAVQLQLNNSVYETYGVELGAMADLIMASTTFHGLAVAGGSAYSISVKSPTSIT